MRSGVILVSALLLIPALRADAQQPVSVQFSAGRVTLVARNAPIRTILAEWARLGGATVVNGERVAGAPVTLELTNVPERQALDVILRGVAGYMLAPRRAGSVGASAFDRIMILPTSAAPRNPPPVTAAAARPGIPRRVVMPPRAPEAAPDAPVEVEVEDAVESDAVASPPVNPALAPRVPPVVRPLPGAEPSQDQPESDDQGAPAAGTTVTTTPSNPFGLPVGSSATPGVISPVPRPQQQPPTNRVQ
jgi:hypothetical protein